MKKITVFFVVLLFLSSHKEILARDTDNKFYLKVGYSLPTWTSYGQDKTDWDFYRELDYNIYRAGGSFKFGSIFFPNALKLPGNFVLGVNAEYVSLIANTFIFDTETEWDRDQDVLSNLLLTSNVGPLLSYNAYGDIFIDTYFHFNFSWITSLISLSDMGEEPDDNLFIGFGDIRYSVGMNIRYKYLVSGVEFGFGSHKLHEIDDDNFYYGNMGDGEKTNMPYLSYSIGICF